MKKITKIIFITISVLVVSALMALLFFIFSRSIDTFWPNDEKQIKKTMLSIMPVAVRCSGEGGQIIEPKTMFGEGKICSLDGINGEWPLIEKSFQYKVNGQGRLFSDEKAGTIEVIFNNKIVTCYIKNGDCRMTGHKRFSFSSIN